MNRHFGTREPLELEESLGTPVVEWLLQGRLGMETVPEGQWCRMVARSHPSWSFRNKESRRKKPAVKNYRKKQDTDTSSIAISLRRR